VFLYCVLWGVKEGLLEKDYVLEAEAPTEARTYYMAKVLISMREEFLEQIDEIADSEQRTRSELIRQALRVYMRRRRQSETGNSVVESILADD
jgi:CopG family transcriptional regulator / antitoxin EndoAI